MNWAWKKFNNLGAQEYLMRIVWQISLFFQNMLVTPQWGSSDEGSQECFYAQQKLS